MRCSRLAVTVAAAVLMKPVAAWAGTDVWTSLGPDGGDATGLVVDPGNSNTVYALTHAGLFKSTNGGSSWSGTAPLPTNGLPLSLVIDPRNTSVLYAARQALNGEPGDWVFKSTDGGASWRALKSGLPAGLTAPLAIDPQDPQTIYSVGYDDILKSTDGGETWKTLNAGLNPLLITSMVRAIAIDPQNPATIYAAAGRWILKSTDRGASWTTVYAHSYPDPRFASIAIDPQDSNTLYCAGFRRGGVYGGGVYKSTNAGASWRAVDSGLPTTPREAIHPNGVLIHTRNPRTLYLVTYYRIYWSTDGAESWKPVGPGIAVGPEIKGVDALAIDPRNPDTFYASTYRYFSVASTSTEPGIFKSTDAAATWRAINSGLRANRIVSLAFIPTEPAALYAYSWTGSFKSTDQGTSWSEGKFPYPLAVDPQDPLTFFAFTGKTTDGGATFTSLGAGFSAVAIDPHRRETIYAGSRYPGNGVLKSKDGAASWARLDAQPEGNGIYGLSIDPRNPAAVYAWNGRGAFKSADGGGSWNKLRCGHVNHMAFDPRDSNVLYAAIDDVRPESERQYVCDDDRPGIYKSTDGGATWAAINAGLGTIQPRRDVISSLIVDPREASTLYAVVENGAFRSRDAGASWQALNSGLTGLAVHALALHPQDSGKLYAGTAGGVFEITLAEASQ